VSRVERLRRNKFSTITSVILLDPPIIFMNIKIQGMTTFIKRLTTMFKLHQKLSEDTICIGQLPLCKILLMNNELFPWIILVPKHADITEIHQLNETDRKNLIEEVSRISEVLQEVYSPDKINIGALGNIVPQLHIHIIARFKNDVAWPDPVWGKDSHFYQESNLAATRTKLQASFCKINGFICD